MCHINPLRKQQLQRGLQKTPILTTTNKHVLNGSHSSLFLTLRYLWLLRVSS